MPIETEEYQIPESANGYVPIDFSKIRVGVKTLSDAVYKLGDFQRINPRLADKRQVLEAIHYGDLERMRDISNYFYKISGIYQRLCRYMAYMYRYDWLVTPYYSETMKPEKIKEGFMQTLTFLDKFEVKRFFGEVALKVVRNGCYYGYLIAKNGTVVVQELPPRYCRSVYISSNREPVVEFNMKYFDDAFPSIELRQRILKIFPAEFEKGYKLYKQGKLKPQYPGD